jgi:molecular chaperone GrpE
VSGSGSEVRADTVSADLDRLLEDTKRERDEYLELAQRARADFENYRKRAAREATDAERRGRSSLAKALVPSLDNLERALGSAEGAGEGLVQGVELVYRELSEALAKAGVEAYDPSGEAFDAALHEAVATRPADGSEPGTVVETLAKGYRIDDQVLRAAKVVVGE